MKILYILSNLNRSAPNTVILNIIKELKAEDISVLSLNNSSNDNYKNILDDLGVHYVEYSSLPVAVLNIYKSYKLYRDVKVLHLNGYHSNVFGFILKKLRGPYQIISTCHSEEDKEIQSYNISGIAIIKSKIKLYLQKKFYKNCERVIAVSDQVRFYLESIGCKNSLTIYNGIDYSIFRNLLTVEVDSGCVNICQVGHVMLLKNQMYSIKLLDYLKSKGLNVQLHLFGCLDKDKAYVTQIKDYIKKNDLSSSIKLYGALQFDELFSYLDKMDIFMMPSLSEGLPLALLESFYFGLPAVVSQNGGMKEIVGKYGNGLIVNIDNEKEFERIYQYIDSDQFILDGEISKDIAFQYFSSGIMSRNYFKEYEKLNEECINLRG